MPCNVVARVAAAGRSLGQLVVVGTAFGAVPFLAASTSHAQQPPPSVEPEVTKPWGPRLTYETAPGCLPESTFRDSVAVFYGGEDPFDPNAPDRLHVTFEKIPGGFRGVVQYTPLTGDPWPPEQMTHASCSALFHSLVLVATLRIPDPPKAPPPSTPSPPTEPPPQRKPPDPIVSEPPPARLAPTFETQPQPPKPPMDLTIALSASALMTAGFTADVGPAFQIGADARFEDRFSLGLELRGVLPGKVYARQAIDPALPTLGERAFDVSLLSAHLVPCVRFAQYFAGCAAVEGGVLIAQSPKDQLFLPSLGVGPRLGVDVPLGERFAVFGFAEAMFYPVAPLVLFNIPGPSGQPPNVRWQSSFVTGFFGAGLSVKFK